MRDTGQEHDMGMRADNIEKFGLGSKAMIIMVVIIGCRPETWADVGAWTHALRHVVPTVPRIRTVESDEQLEAAVCQADGFPTSQIDERARVVAIIRAVLSGERQGHSVVDATSRPSEPTRTPYDPTLRSGSFGLVVDTQDSDIDGLVVVNIPPRTFWSLACGLLHKLISKSHDYDTGGSEKDLPSLVK